MIFPIGSGVSRTVVREALRHLEAEGLLHIVPNHGPVVSSISLDEAREMYETREALESIAAGYCALRATAVQKRELARQLERVTKSYRAGFTPEALQAKDNFYEAMFDGAGNRTLAGLLRMLQVRARILRGYSLSAPGRMDESAAELVELVRAVNDGDAERARDVASVHVRNAGTAALKHLAELTGKPIPEDRAGLPERKPRV